MKPGKYEFTMQLLSAMAAEKIARKKHISKIAAFDKFMRSKTAAMLFDEKCLMWHNGPDYIADEYFREQAACFTKHTQLC